MVKTQKIFLVGNLLSAHFGTTSISEELCYHLRSKGWQVITASNKPYRISRLLDIFLSAIRYRNVYTLANVEVYSGNAFMWAEWVSALLRYLDKPYILTLHGGNLIQFSNQHPERVKLLLSKANLVTSPSHQIQTSLLRFNTNINYIPNGIDINSYNFKLRSNPAPKLIWLRALHAIYQPDTAVHTLTILRSDFPTASLILIGPDKKDGTRQRIERLAVDLGVQNSMKWIGPIPKSEVSRNLNKGDVFLNTTLNESFGVSVMEAAACGLPIVTTNVGELTYLWQDGYDALLVNPSNAEEMAAAVQRILTNHGLAENLSRNARQNAEKYDWSLILPLWESLFMQVINHG